MPEEVTVGVRELKAHLGRYLRVVRQGGTIVVTNRRAPVALIRPAAISGQEPPLQRFRSLAEAGVVSWDGREPQPYEPTATLRGEKTMADLVVENRE